MNQEFVFEAPKTTVGGAGCITRIGEFISGVVPRKALIVTDIGILKSGLVERITAEIKKNDWDTEILAVQEKEPDVEGTDHIIEQSQKFDCGLIVGIGGGSVIDITKVLGCVYKTDLNLSALLDGVDVPKKSVPTCIIPTTAGTGAEATKNAIFALPEKKLKEAIISSNFLPDFVFLDPDLTLSLPLNVTASTGMDALCHALECYLSLKANPLSDILAMDSLRRIGRSIEKAYSESENIEARTDMLFASYYAGLCISLSGTTAVHALSYPLGAQFHIPHGIANAILLAPVIEYNAETVKDKICKIAPFFGVEKDDSDRCVAQFTNKLSDLGTKMNLPERLSSFGIAPSDIDGLVDSAFGIKRLLDNNPKKMSREDIRMIYEKMC